MRPQVVPLWTMSWYCERDGEAIAKLGELRSIWDCGQAGETSGRGRVEWSYDSDRRARLSGKPLDGPRRVHANDRRRMARPVSQTNQTLEPALLVLEVLQVAFLWTHDWIPFGRLNDIAAVRREDSLLRLVAVTLTQSVPWTIGLFFTGWYFGRPYPAWLSMWLFVTYVLLFVGQLRAWWVPYLLKPDRQRAQRYHRMFGNTHSFLPKRNGMVPNTAHILLHLATAATLVILLMNSLTNPRALL